MFIKSIILDGFKSYGIRTEIHGFDPEFNAITGYNGSGKSNILDSICFVLGISNISHVRANSLQELIYKSGQAGVTKASVTLVFDNCETSKSPINYEQFPEITVARQIAVAGKNRFLINGSAVTSKALTDFFTSIQLNVNNPHFLIMQGRITKVLNMKPPEILSMIEEAAGTRMYENKKHDAQRTIEKKDGKVKEINEMVTDQINPKLQKMKDERSQYLEYLKIQREYDSISRSMVVWQFIAGKKHYDSATQTKKETEQREASLRKTIDSMKRDCQTLDEDISEKQVKRDKETGGILQKLENDLKEAEKIEGKISAIVKDAKETVSTEEKNCKQLEKSTDDDEKALAHKTNELSKAQSVFDQLRDAQTQDAEALGAAQCKVKAVSSGLLANEDGENASLHDQLMAAKKQLTEAETEIKKCTLELQNDEKELNKKRPLLKKTEITFATDQKELQSKEKELNNLKENLSKNMYQEGQLEALQEQYRAVSADCRNCSDAVNNFTHRYPQLNFQYRDPEPYFDHRKVRGHLCKLFAMKDEKYARALEAAAGGKLYNVVVDNEEISSKLIMKGQLVRRTTFAPLNKIQGHRLDNNFMRKVQGEYGANNVFLAQSLVDYNPEYESIMSWTFGQTLICSNIDVAEKVCFHLKKRTITLDGDVFDPQGVISGGAVEKKQPMLLVLKEFKSSESILTDKKQELKVLDDEIRRLTPIALNYETMREKFKMREREVQMVQARLEQTSHFQLQTELKSLQESVDKNKIKIEQCKKEVKDKSAKASELEYKIKNLHSIKEQEVAKAEAELERAKKKAEDSRNKWKQREQEFETLRLEIQELEKAIQTGKEQIRTSRELISQYEEELNKKTEELLTAQADVKEKKAAVKKKKTEIGQQNSEIQEKVTEKDKLLVGINNLQLEVVKVGHQIVNLEKDINEALAMEAHLKKNNPWLEESQEYMQDSSVIEINSKNEGEVQAKIEELKSLRDKMAKNVNSKALESFGNQEERYHDVMTKKKIIEEDRSKILSVIEELDVKKEEVIRRAWDRVNTDFHAILSSLLPSAQAKLRPIDRKDLSRGLEIKVGFGGLWKDSLDELSGGQRSLVALSLILAMLLFKPAPLYILDEVDAALDPSHTQNIGQMLKAHFKQSQFIVVSLKDGMFNNANVLFRTAFIDGMSTVTRTVNSGKK